MGGGTHRLGTPGGREGQDGLYGDVQTGHAEGLEHDLRGVLPVHASVAEQTRRQGSGRSASGVGHYLAVTIPHYHPHVMPWRYCWRAEAFYT